MLRMSRRRWLLYDSYQHVAPRFVVCYHSSCPCCRVGLLLRTLRATIPPRTLLEDLLPRLRHHDFQSFMRCMVCDDALCDDALCFRCAPAFHLHFLCPLEHTALQAASKAEDKKQEDAVGACQHVNMSMCCPTCSFVELSRAEWSMLPLRNVHHLTFLLQVLLSSCLDKIRLRCGDIFQWSTKYATPK